MARGVNKVILIGNAGSDPEVRYSASGAAMASLSLATSESWKDKQSGEMQERTEWHRLKFFGKLAEIVGEYVKKGRQLYIEGSIRSSKYTDKQGVEKWSTDIVANTMQMLGGEPGHQQGQGAPAANAGRAQGGAPQRQAPAQHSPAQHAPAQRQPAPAPEPAYAGGGGWGPEGDDVPFAKLGQGRSVLWM